MKKKIIAIFTSLMVILTSQTGCFNQDKVSYYKSKNIDPTYLNEVTNLEKPTKVNFTDINVENLSNKPYGWGFKKEKSAPPMIDDATQKLLSCYQSYYIDKSAIEDDEKVLYLTFDEGYENGYTSVILDVLKKEKVPAAFFITGPYIKEETELVLRMVNEGHIVGNHTINHPSMPTVAENDKLEKELLDLDRQFAALTGKSMTYIRPPKGEFSERTLAVSSNLGYKSIFWSFAYKDWLVDEQKGVQNAIDSTMPYLHNGAIILLHAVSSDNANALKEIITLARQEGYRFASLDELQ